MKKILFIGLVLIALIIAMPAAVSAATDSAAVTVSGSIGLAVDVSVSSGTLDFGAMTTTNPGDGFVDVTIDTTSNSWTVVASDSKVAPDKGFMKDGTSKLVNALKIKNQAGTLTSLATDYSFLSGTIAGSDTERATFDQTIAGTDTDGTYTITVTFTGTAN